MIKIAQCWDDGPTNDIRLCEILRKYNAKATFNLCPGNIPEKTIYGWWEKQPYYRWNHHGYVGGNVGMDLLHEVYDGFEVASHCMQHENAIPENHENFVRAALDAKKFLEDEFGKECPGFAWPCGRFNPAAMDALRENGIKYARTVLNTTDMMSAEIDCLALPSNCHFMNEGFWNKLRDVKEKGDGIFYFWGHSYELLDSEGLWANFEEKIKILSEDPEIEWIDVKDIVALISK